MLEKEERALLQQAAEGDDQAFHEIIKAYHTTVERFARQIGVREEDLQDVTQEVFIKVYRFIDKYTHGKFSTWLYSVTINVAKDFFRKQKREKEKWKKTVAEKPVMHYEDDMHLSEDGERLHDALLNLDEKYKIPIVLFYFHDATIKEIADIMRMREATVKTRLKRGKERLKACLEKGGHLDARGAF
ncbi:RNA polymerase sigma-70 factor, ECF subfamily [Evansella caseinilytica]|uniref:RNA polymerase sigma-70 factor, ECF subfamily n=1 Tax=Evansella caseinilytica TaxID=1503961 RepID=A0A1H3QUL9_9BACI|nr:RNA polymerase sigma factor [Evansella caseinilytica]SDZ16409.1 RNA polymerase sigma-70 factor, ECF subfamily [Evansella caseinilytica]